jgi:hypothetical protein
MFITKLFDAVFSGSVKDYRKYKLIRDKQHNLLLVFKYEASKSKRF